MTHAEKLAEDEYPMTYERDGVRYDDLTFASKRAAFIAGYNADKWISVDVDTEYDGEYLASIEKTEECGNVHNIQRIITNRMNIWVLLPGERITHWQPLPSPPHQQP